jgi:hypothetical protein
MSHQQDVASRAYLAAHSEQQDVASRAYSAAHSELAGSTDVRL